MAAERIAENLGETVGGRVGYATRLDSKHGADTRILVMTEGIFRNRIISDPELSSVSAVLFDEVHERSIDSDFGLALALEAQAAFRPDLRLLAMSATLDGARFSTLMGNAPVLESEGKIWPLEYLYVGRRTELPIETDIVSILRQALSEQQGDILAFLPGVPLTLWVSAVQISWSTGCMGRLTQRTSGLRFAATRMAAARSFLPQTLPRPA
jgi:ATP-dependent helicase HrpB